MDGSRDIDTGYNKIYPMSTSAGRNVNPSEDDQSRSSRKIGVENMLAMTKQQPSISIRDRVAPEEWEQRVALAAVYRLVAHFHWDDLIFTHLSARVPGPEHHFLINPYGMMFEEITASSLVKIDMHGNPLGRSEHPVNPAGFTIHSAVHMAREDARAVMHLHTPHGQAVSAMEWGLLRNTQTAWSWRTMSPITTMRASPPTLASARDSWQILDPRTL